MEIVDVVEIIVVILILILMISLFKSKKKLKWTRVTLIMFTTMLLMNHLAYEYCFSGPTMNLNGSPNVVLAVNETYIEDGVKVEYHKKDITDEVKIEGNVNSNKVGNYKIKYILKFKDKDIFEIRDVEVVDKIAPAILLKGKEEVKVPCNSEYVEDGYTAIDNYDGEITDKVKIEKKEIDEKHYELHYTVSDSSSNITEAVRKITLVEAIHTENANKHGVIYLTFDDGPSLDITPKILDILKDEGVKATFFILNYNQNTEVFVKRIVEEGHAIGIHGYSHKYEEIYTSVETYMNNIIKLEEKILKSTGIVTKLTRFPGGSSNTISKYYREGIMSKLTKKLLNEGYRYYDWNVASGDAGGAKTKDDVYKNVINGLSLKRANMVLMHDFGGNKKTLDALKDVIQYGKENGYTFEKIDETSPMITHKIAN